MYGSFSPIVISKIITCSLWCASVCSNAANPGVDRWGACSRVWKAELAAKAGLVTRCSVRCWTMCWWKVLGTIRYGGGPFSIFWVRSVCAKVGGWARRGIRGLRRNCRWVSHVEFAWFRAWSSRGRARPACVSGARGPTRSSRVCARFRSRRRRSAT